MISSLQNDLVKHLVKLRENKHYREEQKRVLVTGLKLVHEIALISPPLRVFTAGIPSPFPGIEHVEVTHAVLKKISGVPAPEPIAAEFILPQESTLQGKAPLLVLDAIRDPGNLGTLMRTAAALKWGGIFLLPNCVDPFHEKVIRAARGLEFRLPWRKGSWEELADLKQQENLKAYIADTQGKEADLVKRENKIMLILSNESLGVDLRGEQFGERITIPMEKNVESLNVAAAGAILMYNLRRP